jgi:hypothetical protein
VTSTFKSIDRWMFGWGSPTSLGILRIAVGFLAIFNQTFLAWQYRDWYSDTGFAPRWVATRWLGDLPAIALDNSGRNSISVPRVNLLATISDSRVMLMVLIVTIILSVFLMIGLWTKPVAISLALLVMSLQHQSPAILHGGDTVIRLLIMYLALSPCGLACSADRLIGLWKGRIPPGPVVAPLWTQRVIQVNLAILYLMAVWTKWIGFTWQNGYATWYPNRLAEFERFWIPEFMRQYPMVTITTYGTLVVEFAMVSLVFYRPYRRWVLLLAAGMHLYIEYSMNIPLFSWLMIIQYICFYDGEEVTGWAKRMGERLRRFKVGFSVANKSPGQVAAIEATDPFNLVDIESPTGSTASVTAAIIRSPGSWWICWIPGVARRILN